MDARITAPSPRLLRQGRLLAEDISRIVADPARAQQVDQRRLVDDARPCRVDDEDAGLGLLQLHAIEEAARGLVQREVQADDVGLRQQLVDRHGRHAAARNGRAVVGDHLQADALGDARHFAADAAQPHHAQRLALKLHALHRPPAAAAHDAVHGRDVAGRGEDQAHRMLGDRGVAVAADGRDLDAEPFRRREVDEARGPRAEEDDVLQPGAALQRGLAEIGRVVDDRVIPGDLAGHFVLGHGPQADVDRNVRRPVDLLPHTVDVGCRIDEQCLRQGRPPRLSPTIVRRARTVC